jgi:hypothetical protein
MEPGLKMWVEDVEGLQHVGFHFNINEELNGIDFGQGNVEIDKVRPYLSYRVAFYFRLFRNSTHFPSLGVYGKCDEIFNTYFFCRTTDLFVPRAFD